MTKRNDSPAATLNRQAPAVDLYDNRERRIVAATYAHELLWGLLGDTPGPARPESTGSGMSLRYGSVVFDALSCALSYRDRFTGAECVMTLSRNTSYDMIAHLMRTLVS